MLKSSWSFASTARLTVSLSMPFTYSVLGLAPEPLRDSCASRFESHVARLLDHAQRILRTFVSESLSGCLAGDHLVLSEERQHTHRFPGRDPRIQRDDRDFGGGGSLDRRCHHAGNGKGDGDPGDPVVDRRTHEVGLVGSVGIVGVLQIDVVLGRRGLGASADEVPECVARRLVGHERYRRPRDVSRGFSGGFPCATAARTGGQRTTTTTTRTCATDVRAITHPSYPLTSP